MDIDRRRVLIGMAGLGMSDLSGDCPSRPDIRQTVAGQVADHIGGGAGQRSVSREGCLGAGSAGSRPPWPTSPRKPSPTLSCC
jgi:hypothetical protein